LNRSLSLVAAALRWAKAECDVPCDPGLVGGLKVPEGAARTRRLAPGEEERLLAAARGTAEQGGLPGADEGNPGVWLTSAITLLVETGMRRSEAWALQWRDVDLGRRVARLATTKNGDRGVEIPLSTRALAALQALPRGIGAARVLAGFCCPDTLGDAFRAACKAAGITGLRLHDLRAECVSRLFERGLTLPEVRAVSRHKSAALLRYVRAGDAAELARKLG
jgi:integrase